MTLMELYRSSPTALFSIFENHQIPEYQGQYRSYATDFLSRRLRDSFQLESQIIIISINSILVKIVDKSIKRSFVAVEESNFRNFSGCYWFLKTTACL